MTEAASLSVGLGTLAITGIALGKILATLIERLAQRDRRRAMIESEARRITSEKLQARYGPEHAAGSTSFTDCRWASNTPTGSLIRNTARAMGSLSVAEFMQHKPMPALPPEPSEDLPHSEYLAQFVARLTAEREAERRARPRTWRCDKCGHMETLTDDEVALGSDGLGDLWTAHWPRNAQGRAADVLCDGRVICIGRAR